MIPTPNFEIGQTVYHAWISHGTEDLPCPDCLGTRKWKAITPAGTEVETSCGRCSGYSSHDLPALKRRVWRAAVQTLTIGSVRIDTNSDDPVEYMCRETGIGSGSVYREKLLFANEADAQAYAAQLAAIETANMDEKPEAIHAKKVGLLRIDDATFEEATRKMRHAWYDRNRLKEEIEQSLKECYTFQELHDAVKSSVEYDVEFRDQNPLTGLLAAAREIIAASADGTGRLLEALRPFDPASRKPEKPALEEAAE